MKFAIAVIAMTMAISANASPAPYIQDVVTYSNPWSLKSSTVWPTYGGLYGKELAVVSDVSYGKYPYQNGYGNWPAYGKNWGYSSPVVAVGANVVGNGLWNYGGSGYGYGKNWGYSSPVVTVGAKLANNDLWNYGGYGYGLGHNKYWL
ncbi:cuticle protein 64-like [Armigeres subalbatus]|uniref:cuticle protein 64-like n=1 Tax=Armigeres subalbatus TaxID=124917 RepID=UPI002ED6196D